MKEVDSLALANVQLNLQSSYKAFFDKKRKKRSGFPKFKSRKHTRKSYTTNNQKGTVAIIEKWADKDEQNLAMKQEPIIDKLRAEIETKYGQCSICEYDSIDGDFDGVYTDTGDIADILQTDY